MRPDPAALRDALLRRARRRLIRDVRKGALTRSQARGLYRATMRRYSERLGLPPLRA